MQQKAQVSSAKFFRMDWEGEGRGGGAAKGFLGRDVMVLALCWLLFESGEGGNKKLISR